MQRGLQARSAQWEPVAADMPPEVYRALHKQRSVFAPQSRIKMNLLAIILNVIVPCGFFALCNYVSGFSLRYHQPVLANVIIIMAILAWLGLVALAVWARKNEPNPVWYSFMAMMVGFALLFGIRCGRHIYEEYELKYLEIKDMKNYTNFDVSSNAGQNVIDGGIFEFASGNKLDLAQTWHFKEDTVYCVAPIVGSSAATSYDFWAVGQDCCSNSGSDYRCGDAQNASASGAVRMLTEKDVKFYKLAVLQAETMYGILAAQPLFFEWSADPAALVASWKVHASSLFFKGLAAFFVFNLYSVGIGVCCYARIGRGSINSMNFHDDPDWRKGGPHERIDLRAHRPGGPYGYM